MMTEKLKWKACLPPGYFVQFMAATKDDQIINPLTLCVKSYYWIKIYLVSILVFQNRTLLRIDINYDSVTGLVRSMSENERK